MFDRLGISSGKFADSVTASGTPRRSGATASLRKAMVAAFVLAGLCGLLVPGVGHAQTNSCVADPIDARDDYSDSVWVKSGWNATDSRVATNDDDVNASLYQDLSGVSPQATITFRWSYQNASGGNNGHAFRIRLTYAGTSYWTARSSHDGDNNVPASEITAQNGATCLAGCSTALGEDVEREIQLRLPAGIPSSGRLEITAVKIGNRPGGYDDPRIYGPMSMTGTGICLAKISNGGTGTFNFTTSGVDSTMGGGGTTANVTTTTAGTAAVYDASANLDGNQPLLVNNPGSSANVVITESSLPAGFSLDSVDCPSLSPVRSGNSISISNVPLDTVTTCTFSNTRTAPTLSLQKALGAGGRISANDQFSLSGTGTGAAAAKTTTGSGSAVTSTAYSFTATAGTAYTLNEAMATGSASTLSQYSQAVSCTNTGPTNVSSINSLPISVTPTWNDAISCVVTNTRKAPTLSLQKAMGTGGRISANDQFSLSGTGTGAAAAKTTTGSNSAVTSTPYSFTATAGTAYTLNEAMATGSASTLSQYSQTVSCTNTGPTSVSGINALPISVTPTWGDAISCVVTNTRKSPTISLQKAMGTGGRISANDQFSLSGTGTGTAAAKTTTGSNSAVTSTPYSFTAIAGTAYTLNEAMATGSASTLSQYSQTVSCTNTGPTSVSGINALPISVTPTYGDAISCVVTNTRKSPTISLQKAMGSGGRISADDQFSLSGTGAGSAAAKTTTGTGSAVTSTPYSFTATAGTAYTLNEAMATGSASTLSQYSQAVSCTNTGPTSVSGINALPISVTPTWGDAISCVVTNTRIAPTLSLQKAMGTGGRISADDQFSLSGTGTGAAAAKTTTGAGSAVTSSAYSFTATAGTAYSLTEAMATGSASTLSQYSQTVSCTNTGPTNVSGINSLPISVTPTYGDAISCVVTNTRKSPTISLQKALGTGGRISADDQFSLSGTGTGAAAAKTTTGTGSAVTSTPYSFTATAGTAYTLNEAMATGSASTLSQYSQTVSCTNTGPTSVSGINALPISVTPTWGDAISCVVTNTRKSPTISLQKAMGTGGRISANDQFSLSGTGTGTAAAKTTTGSNSAVTSTPYSFTATAGTAYTLNEAMATGSASTLSQYSQALSCTNTGPTSVSSINALPISVTPTYGDAISCVVTNTRKSPTISLQKAMGSGGRISADDQFSLSGTGTGAAAAKTTTGSGSEISSTSYSFTATAGTAYSLNEAMAAGSASTLSQYSQTVSCSNTGPTSVSGINSLPISVTPTYGDAISCVVTNTRKAPTLSLQKALGTGGRISADDQFSLSGTGTGAAAAKTTTGSGSEISSTSYSFTATAGTAYSLNEAMATGSASTLSQYSQAVSCTNTGPTNVSGINSLPISVTPTYGDAISCVVTNTRKSPTLSLQKALGTGGRISADDQFSLSGTGTGAAAAKTTTGAGSAVTSSAYSFTATAGTAYSLTEAMATGSASTLSQYSQAVSCTNTGPTNVSGINALPISVTPTYGDAINCVVTNTRKSPTLSLQKALGTGGRISADDQFSLSGTGTGAAAAKTTTGAGSAVTSTAYSFTATAGTAYSLTEAMATGSASTLSQYSQVVSCANTGPTNVSGINALPISVTPTYGDAINCVITNTAKAPSLSLQKALGGNRISSTDQFTLSSTGAGAAAAKTTTGATNAITSTPYTFTATPGTAYTLNEAMASGSASTLAQYSQSVSCSNTGPTDVSGINGLPISVTPTYGDAIACTVTNTPKAPTLSLQKAMGTGGRISANDQFSLSGTGTGAAAAKTTTGSNSAVTSTPYSFTATAGTAYTLNEAMATGSASTLSQYSQTVSCTNTGPTSVSGINALPISVTPTWGDAISCVVTNTRKAPTLSLQKALGTGGRISADDQFSLSGTGAGSAAAKTTTGTGSAVTSAPYSFTATAGTAYTLNEAMATGSASTLSQYSQTVSCTNTGPTSVSGINALPISVTPTYGDAISCVVTNSRKAPTLSLQKAMGAGGRLSADDQFTLFGDGAGAPAAVTTTGSGETITSAAYSFTATEDSSYFLDEAMAAGSSSSLSDYEQAVTCSNQGPTDVSGIVALPVVVTPKAGDAISCVVTNTPQEEEEPVEGGTAPSEICNADPVAARSNFTDPVWTKSGNWHYVQPTAAMLKDDDGDASLAQDISGVTPGALLTFSWRFRDGVVRTGDAGNQSRLLIYYGGTTYWQGLTSDGPGSSPASTALGGATCVSGCGALSPNTNRTVKIRLPANVPISGRLQFRAQQFGGTSDDVFVISPISIASTGICLVKTSRGGTGTFNFETVGLDSAMGGGGTAASITTSDVNTPHHYDASATLENFQPLLVKNPGSAANVTITESPAAEFVIEDVSCTGVTPVRSGNSVSIANVPRDTVATCTFTNRTAIISLNKALGGNRYAPNDNFSVAIRRGGVSGTIVSSTTHATTTGSGAKIDPGTGTTGDFYATPGIGYTLTEAGTSGTSLSNYNARLTCTDAAGVTPAGGLPTDEVFNPATGREITPVAGAKLRCSITNTPKNARISLQKALGGSGRIASSDQFTLSGSGSGAPAPITTTGTGSFVSSPAYEFYATVGSSYVLNEAMAPGSSSALSAYRQNVQCSNTGPTDVSGQTTLPINITPAAGDAISCVITNSPKGAVPPGQGSGDICNADPIIAGNDLAHSAWTHSGGWDVVTANRVELINDEGDAQLSQSISGVTPGATLTFTWRFKNGIISSGDSGNRAQLYVYYNTASASHTYFAAETSQGAGNAPASSAQGGAICVSGCGALAPETNRTVTLRLPDNVATNGTLIFRVRTTGGTSDDVAIRQPISIRNTGICLVKNSVGGTGQFDFSTEGLDTTMGGGGTTASILTTEANKPQFYDASPTRINNQPLLVTKPGNAANIKIAEVPAAGFVLDSVSCTDGLTPVRAGNAISIANVPRDTVATCTFNNSTSSIKLSKALSAPRHSASDNFTVAIRTGGADGAVVSSMANATTMGSGSTVEPGSGTNGDLQTLPGTTYTLTEEGTPGVNLANYGATLSCTDTAAVTPEADLPSNEFFDPATGRDITPLAGAKLDCVITNGPAGATLTGRVILDTGTGGGTAHDGAANGSEAGRAGATVKLTDCGTTEYGSATTDAGGNFVLSLQAVPAGEVCLVKLPNASYIPVSAHPGTTGGTYTQSSDSLAFTLAADTSYSGVVLGDVPKSRLLTDGLRQIAPGATVYYPHRFEAGTSASVMFSTSDVSSDGPWDSLLYLDNDCDGQISSGDTPLMDPQTVVAGQSVCLLNRVTAPAGAAEGAQNVTTVSALETLTPVPTTGPLSVEHNRTDTTTVGQSSLMLTKEVRRLPSCPVDAAASMGSATAYTTNNEAEAGDALEYRIGYRNETTVAVTQVRITDAVPAYTLFQDAWCLSTPTDGIAGCSVTSKPSAGAGSGTIIWELQDSGAAPSGLRPGAQGAVSFCVTVEH